jgi:transposase
MQHWMRAGCFERIAEDAQSLSCQFGGRKGPIDRGLPRQSDTAVHARIGCPRRLRRSQARRNGSKVHIAIDTLGNLLALTVTPADQGDRTQVEARAQQMQQVTGDTVELAYVDQGYTGENAAAAAQNHGIRLEVVKHPMARRGFVLLPRRWVVERSVAWAARFRKLARAYERLDNTLKGFHYLSFACLMINQNIPPTQPSVITASSDKRTAAEDHQRPSAEPVRQSPLQIRLENTEPRSTAATIAEN